MNIFKLSLKAFFAVLLFTSTALLIVGSSLFWYTFSGTKYGYFYEGGYSIWSSVPEQNDRLKTIQAFVILSDILSVIGLFLGFIFLIRAKFPSELAYGILTGVTFTTFLCNLVAILVSVWYQRDYKYVEASIDDGTFYLSGELHCDAVGFHIFTAGCVVTFCVCAASLALCLCDGLRKKGLLDKKEDNSEEADDPIVNV